MGFKIEGDGMCLSILCAGSSKVYGVYSCTKDLYAACEKGNKFNTLNCLDIILIDKKMFTTIVGILCMSMWLSVEK